MQGRYVVGGCSNTGCVEHEGISITADSEDHSSLVIGYYKKKTAKTLVGGVSKNKKIRERVDSRMQFVWRLRVMGSWQYQ